MINMKFKLISQSDGYAFEEDINNFMNTHNIIRIQFDCEKFDDTLSWTAFILYNERDGI